MFAFCILDSGIVSATEEGQTWCSGEAYDLGSSFADVEKHIFVRYRHSMENRYYNIIMSTLTL